MPVVSTRVFVRVVRVFALPRPVEVNVDGEEDEVERLVQQQPQGSVLHGAVTHLDVAVIGPDDGWG